MGVVWSSPYRWQLLAVCFGLFVLTTGLVFLLLSIGLEDDFWRLMGGICASMGSALAVTGTCWCVWVVRHGRYGDGLAINVPDCEAETLTGDGMAWHDNMAANHNKSGFYDDDDMETDEEGDYDDDEEEEEEEEESEVVEGIDKGEDQEQVKEGEGVISKGQQVKGQTGETSERTLTLKDGVQERLIPV